MAVSSRPCTHISYAPPRMVVLAWRPTAERPIMGCVLATMSTIAAASVSASGRLSEAAGRLASVSPHRGPRAFPPGGSGGVGRKGLQPRQAPLLHQRAPDILPSHHPH